ncbi:MAG: 3-hydroxyacyl-CoA dehydrogenase PaaC [Nevskia sp.]|nr:3-hydroxyacyl-CoA dehydrogenase PaaC [Nevskia sp.]
MSALHQSAVVAVIGAGAMGAGIAQVAAQAGHPVVLFDAKDGAADSGRAGILASLDRSVSKGRLDADERDSIAARLRVATSLADCAPAELVVEAIVESLEVKRKLFAALEDVVKPATILATNTSSLSVTAIAAQLQHPYRVAGMHFFNPAPLMALVEIVSGLGTAPDTLDSLFQTALAWGKQPVRTRSTPGFIVNRVARPFYAEGLRLLEEGAADAPTIDAVIRESGGFRMGPFELMDLIGHDVNFAVTRSIFEAYFGDPRFRPSLTQQELVAAGWLGRKASRGFYDYRDGAPKVAARNEEAGPAPTNVVIEGELGPAESLAQALVAAGIPVERMQGPGYIRIADATLSLTDGRTATERVSQGEPTDLVLFDLALDYAATPRIAIAAAHQGHSGATAAAAGLFQVMNKSVSVLGDLPGLVVLRTVAMLTNEAADAVLQAVATVADIDRAMTLGVNYPLGPLAWADRIDLGYVLGALDALHLTYGDDRYRASLLLRQSAAAGSTFHERREGAPAGRPAPATY